MDIKRMRSLGISAVALLFAAGLWGFWPVMADSKPPESKTSESKPSQNKPVAGESDILPYLEQVIAWQRETVALEPTLGSARESLLKTSLVRASSDVLKYSFGFARVEALQADKNASDASAGDQDADKTHLQGAAMKVAARVTALQTQIATLTDQIKKTPVKAQPPLQQQLDDLNGQLKLALAQQDLIGNLLNVFNSISGSVNTGLSGKIDSLSDSVTQSDKATDAATAKADAANAAKDNDTPAGGLLQVTSNLFKLWRQINDLHSLEDASAGIRKTNKDFQDQLRSEIRDAVAQGLAMGNPAPAALAAQATPNTNAPAPAPVPAVAPAPIATVPQTLDGLLTNFKQLSAAIVPVTQIDVSLGASIHTIEEWQQTVRAEIEALLRRLAIRLAVLGGLILIPVVIADLVRRATDRYVKDDKRAKQLRTVRRSLLSLAIFIIVVLNLVTEVGSFATFAGFIVGGLAVAFQNVLLSLVAFFFFYGRYSVRAGDRVSVSGVIGDVVHVGGLRFYIRELQDKDGKLEATGRVAAFPNSILFQTSAFFKYMDP